MNDYVIPSRTEVLESSIKLEKELDELETKMNLLQQKNESLNRTAWRLRLLCVIELILFTVILTN